MEWREEGGKEGGSDGWKGWKEGVKGGSEGGKERRREGAGGFVPAARRRLQKEMAMINFHEWDAGAVGAKDAWDQMNKKNKKMYEQFVRSGIFQCNVGKERNLRRCPGHHSMIKWEM